MRRPDNSGRLESTGPVYFAGKKPRLSKKRLLYVAPFANFLGGLAFILSGLAGKGHAVMENRAGSQQDMIPAGEVERLPDDPAFANQLDAPEPAKAPEVLGLTADELKEIEDLAEQWGWKFLSVSTATGAVNGLALGRKRKQASITLSSLLQLATVPVMVANLAPSIALKTAFPFMIALFNAGYANIQDEEGGKRKAPQSQKPNAAGDSPPLTMRRVGDGVFQLANDQYRVFSESPATMKQLLQSGLVAVRNPKEAWEKLKAADPETPGQAIEESGDVTRVGAMLLMTGSLAMTPVLLLAGEASQLVNFCTTVLGMGTFFLNGGLLQSAVATGNKKLMIAVPLNILGFTLGIRDTLMYGLGQLGGAGVMWHMAELAGEEAQTPEKPPKPPDSTPPPPPQE